MITILQTTAFLALALAAFLSVLRGVGRHEDLSFGEKLGFASTLIVYTLTLIAMMSGFLGVLGLKSWFLGLALFSIPWHFLPERSSWTELRQEVTSKFRQFIANQDLLSSIFLFSGSFIAIFFLILGIALPAISADGLSYHLGTALHVAQDGDFRHYPGESGYTNYFARGVELLMALTVLLTGSILPANAVQWLCLPVVAVTVYTGCRALGLESKRAMIAAFLPMAVPTIMYQTTIAYADLWSLAWFTVGTFAALGAIAREKLSPWRVLWFFAAAGLAFAAKLNAAIPVFFMGIFALIVWFGLSGKPWRQTTVMAALAGLIVSALLGLAWPAKNWVHHGSPIYPWSVEIGSWKIAEGLLPMAGTRMMPDPPPWDEMSLLEKSLKSWTFIDTQSVQEFGVFGQRMDEASPSTLNDMEFGYRGDNRFGGLGLAWLMLYLPALIALVPLAWLVGGNRKTKVALCALALLPWIVYTTSIASYWPRFSLYLPIFGGVAFVAILAALERQRKSLAMIGWLLLLAVYTADGFTITFHNRDRERLRRFQEDIADRPSTPIEYIHWISPQVPEHVAIHYMISQARPGETVSLRTPGLPVYTGLFADATGTVRLYPFPTVWPSPDFMSLDEMMEAVDRERIALLVVGPTASDEFVAGLSSRGARQLSDHDGFRVIEIPKHRN